MTAPTFKITTSVQHPIPVRRLSVAVMQDDEDKAEARRARSDGSILIGADQEPVAVVHVMHSGHEGHRGPCIRIDETGIPLKYAGTLQVAIAKATVEWRVWERSGFLPENRQSSYDFVPGDGTR